MTSTLTFLGMVVILRIYDYASINANNFNVNLFGDEGYFSNGYSASINANNFNVNLFGESVTLFGVWGLF